MKIAYLKSAILASAIVSTGIGSALQAAPKSTPEQYTTLSLDSNVNGVAQRNSDRLLGPWGAAVAFDHTIWVANNLGGTVIALRPDGGLLIPKGSNQGIIFTIPPAGGSGTGTPTGIRFNEASGNKKATAFQVGGVTAQFLIATQDGAIAAWSGESAVTPVATLVKIVPGASYLGLALNSAQVGTATSPSQYLYACNVNTGKIDVFDGSYVQQTSGFSFTDPNALAGYVPVNLKSLALPSITEKGKKDSYLVVAYTQVLPANPAAGTDLSAAPLVKNGGGYLDVFKTDGTFVSRLDTNETGTATNLLNSPWGLAHAGNVFWVANHSDGLIHRFILTENAPTGEAVTVTSVEDPSPLQNSFEQTLDLTSVWAIHFDFKHVAPAELIKQGEDAFADDSIVCYTMHFTPKAGLADGENGAGIFGRLHKDQ